MALSKSRRFEIFKRDSFTCQYCGQHPPEVILEVDHIEPRAVGGSDDELNLITSCADCNRGKSARLLGDVHPRPDADMKYLEVQQEIAEVRRYQDALAGRESANNELIHDLQCLWVSIADPDLDWQPAVHIMRRFLNRYDPETVEAAIRDVIPKIITGYVGGQWDRYMWAVMKHMTEDE